MFLLLPVFLLSGCSTNYVESIDVVREGDIVKIVSNMSDGSKESEIIQVVQGQDGKDGEDLTITTLFDELVEKGLYEETEFDVFLHDYFKDEYEEYENNLSLQFTNKALQSAVIFYSEFHIPQTKKSEMYCGAGVIYKMDEDYSYILTNYHVVYLYKSADNYTVNNYATNTYIYTYGGQVGFVTNSTASANGYVEHTMSEDALEVEILGGAAVYDTAVVRVETAKLKEQNPTARAVDVADMYSAGEDAIAIGNPEGEGVSVTKGVVSVESQNLTMQRCDSSEEHRFRVMRIDTSVNGGNSGGGLYNKKGELIGLVNAKTYTNSEGKDLENYAYALPVDMVVKVADQVIEKYDGYLHEVTRVLMGVTYNTDNAHQVYENGLITLKDEFKIVDVTSGKVADRCGIQKDDVVQGVIINGTTHLANRAFEIGDWLLACGNQDKVAFVVLRNGVTFNTSETTIQNSDLVIVDKE